MCSRHHATTGSVKTPPGSNVRSSFGIAGDAVSQTL